LDKRDVALAVLMLGVILCGSLFAATAFNSFMKTYTWNKSATIDFTVWDSISGGSQITTDETPTSDPSTLTYYIQNDGNVPIRVTGALSVTDGTIGSTIWNPSTGYVDVPVGQRILISVTLSGFSVGQGSFTVSFNSAQVP